MTLRKLLPVLLLGLLATALPVSLAKCGGDDAYPDACKPLQDGVEVAIANLTQLTGGGSVDDYAAALEAALAALQAAQAPPPPEFKTRVLNFVGGPGVGKTTSAAAVFAELKARGVEAEYVPEYVKSLVWAGQTDLINDQYYLSLNQYKQIKALCGKVDIVVTDGALFTGLYFNGYYTDNVSNTTKTADAIRSWMAEFDNDYVFLTKGNWTYDNNGRMQSEDESARITGEMRDMLDAMGLEYLQSVSDASNYPTMVEYALSAAGIEA